MKANFVLTGAALVLASGLWGCTSQADGKQPSALRDSCINPTQIEKQQIVSNSEIRFTMRNGDVWVNTLTSACPGLKIDQGFTWEVRGTLVCSNEQTIYSQSGAPCQLGEFSRAPAAEK